MITENDNWVKVKILKHMMSIYGSHFPGAIVTIPERVAKNWVENKIAVPEPVKEVLVKPVGKLKMKRTSKSKIKKTRKPQKK